MVAGTALLCAGTSGVAYSCSEILNASSYTWTFPAGATIASGAGTRNIMVDYAPGAVSGNITVAGTNSCGNGTASPPFAVTVNPLPADAGSITGPISVCAFEAGIVYSVPPILNATAYTWLIPPCMTITSGLNTNSIGVTFGAPTGLNTLAVKGANSCGAGAVSPGFVFNLKPVPAAPDVSVTGNVLTSSSPAGNQWYYEGSAIAGAIQQSYTVTNNTGYYGCRVTLLGCTSPASNQVWVVVTGQQDLQFSTINVYPVPNQGRFTLSLTSRVAETCSIAIYNEIGVRIYELGEILVNGLTEKQVDIRPAVSGIYTIVLFNKDQRVVRKMVIGM